MQYILTYGNREHIVYFIFNRDVFRACKAPKMKFFVKIVNDFQSLTIFAKKPYLCFN